jgi:hypothetical protein
MLVSGTQKVFVWCCSPAGPVRPSAGVVTLALSPFVPAAALLGARFRADSGCLLADSNGLADDPEAPSPANMGRRRSRAVLYQLSGHYKPEKTKLKLNNVSILNISSKGHPSVCLIRLGCPVLAVSFDIQYVWPCEVVEQGCKSWCGFVLNHKHVNFPECPL